MGSASPDSPSGAAYTKKIEYNYDDDGNRTSVVVTPYGQSPATTSYSTNTLNQYTAVGGVSHSWDGNGNLSDDGTLTYEYNYRNEICRVKNGGTTVATYKYDALGRRVEKAVTGGVTERYVYAGVETIATYDGSNTWKQDFVFGQGIDNVLMLEQADVLDFDADQNTSETTRSFYHKNALGSVMAITDMSEATAVSYRYDPYGTVTITRGGQTQSTDPLGQHWGYAGRYYDEETGGVYSRAREYGPNLGRFGQRDPLRAASLKNSYCYGSNSPVSRCDPTGLVDGPDHRPMPGTDPGNPPSIPPSDPTIPNDPAGLPDTHFRARNDPRVKVGGAKITDLLGNEGFCLAALGPAGRRLAWVQYYKWDLLWEIIGENATSVPTGMPGPQNDPPGNSGLYPKQNGAGTHAVGLGDAPGWNIGGEPAAWAAMVAHPDIFLETVFREAGISPAPPSGVIYAVSTLDLRSFLIDLQTGRVLERVRTVKTYIYNLFGDPQLTQHVQGPAQF